MGFRLGIIGLPNVGKSALFNALTASVAAEASNRPFSTTDANIGRIDVPDPRLETIAAIAKSAKMVATQIDFVDIAGLVRGASRGEGLGNRFLAHLREVDAIAEVMRCFESDEVAHVEAGVDPLRDSGIVETELMLADLESVERRIEPLVKKARGGDKEAAATVALLERARKALAEGRPVRTLEMDSDDKVRFDQLQLITTKPILYVCNVEEASAAIGNAYSDKVLAHAAAEGASAVVVSAAIEADIAQLGEAAERADFLASIGFEESGLDRVIQTGYALLGLVTYFTAGPKEARAWTIEAGATAREAAGKIHSDLARGFIAAETIPYDDFIASGGEQGAKDAGKMRLEGRDYVVRDGDVILFRFNV